jgi:hypothetical protein
MNIKTSEGCIFTGISSWNPLLILSGIYLFTLYHLFKDVNAFLKYVKIIQTFRGFHSAPPSNLAKSSCKIRSPSQSLSPFVIYVKPLKLSSNVEIVCRHWLCRKSSSNLFFFYKTLIDYLKTVAN